MPMTHRFRQVLRRRNGEVGQGDPGGQHQGGVIAAVKHLSMVVCGRAYNRRHRRMPALGHQQTGSQRAFLVRFFQRKRTLTGPRSGRPYVGVPKSGFPCRQQTEYDGRRFTSSVPICHKLALGPRRRPVGWHPVAIVAHPGQLSASRNAPRLGVRIVTRSQRLATRVRLLSGGHYG